MPFVQIRKLICQCLLGILEMLRLFSNAGRLPQMTLAAGLFLFFFAVISQTMVVGQTPTDPAASQKADAVLAQGQELEDQGDQSALVKAVPKYEEALRLYREMGNRK